MRIAGLPSNESWGGPAILFVDNVGGTSQLLAILQSRVSTIQSLEEQLHAPLPEAIRLSLLSGAQTLHLPLPPPGVRYD